MRINWKNMRLRVGRIELRLKTMLASLIISAVGALQEMEYIDLSPVVNFFVSDEKRAAFYVAAITVTMTVLRVVTRGPLWEVVPPAPDETEHGVDTP